MIPKTTAVASNTVNNTPQDTERSDATAQAFQQILKEKVDQLRVLELIALTSLSRTIEPAFSSDGDEEDPLSLGSSLSLSLPGPIQSMMGMNIVPGSSLRASNTQQLRQDIDEIVEKAAHQYGVDPALVRAVIMVESGGNPEAVSPVGAQGLMQLMPETAAELGVTNSFDPAQNIMAGTRYLSQLLDRYQGNVRQALAAYNWGMNNIDKNPDTLPKETRDYLARIEKRIGLVV